MNTAIRLRRGDALIVVDIQVDFLPGGALGVPHGDEVVPIINRCLRRFHDRGFPIYASRDWHPADHCSFKPQGGIWPVHCVAGTAGADFGPGLMLPPEAEMVYKATRQDREAYSALDDTGLEERLRQAGVERLFIGGLATDYCVLNTVRDALRMGFEAVVLRDACRAVNVEPGDGEAAEKEMRQRGARLIVFDDLEEEE
ncbi:MAG: nicotinamidase [Lysobacterales bacterium]|jgi:nicotinamidase/pyrazinamidase